MRFHGVWRCVEQVFGCSVRQQVLTAVRLLDNPRAITPFLLETGGRRLTLALSDDEPELCHQFRVGVRRAMIPAAAST